MLERGHDRLREADATTLANAFAFLAVALQILPKEISDLVLVSTPNLASNISWVGGDAHSVTPARHPSSLPPAASNHLPPHVRYYDLAIETAMIAGKSDTPSVMRVMLKFMLYRYCMVRRDRLIPAKEWLVQAIAVAQALGMAKEWEGIPQGERELRRRLMWSLYVADRSVHQ